MTSSTPSQLKVYVTLTLLTPIVILACAGVLCSLLFTRDARHIDIRHTSCYFYCSNRWLRKENESDFKLTTVFNLNSTYVSSYPTATSNTSYADVTTDIHPDNSKTGTNPDAIVSDEISDFTSLAKKSDLNLNSSSGSNVILVISWTALMTLIAAYVCLVYYVKVIHYIIIYITR